MWRQFQAHFAWYDRAASRNRYGYLGLRLAAVIVGAAVTVLAAVDARPVITATLAALIVVSESAQQLFQFHRNWIEYRAVAETLRQHGFLYAAQAGPYADGDRRQMLAKALQEVTAAERTSWTRAMRQATVGGQDQNPESAARPTAP